MWNNSVHPERPQKTTWRMRTACWITWDTNIMSVYVIFTAFPLQILLKERARTQVHTEEVQMKNRVQTQSAQRVQRVQTQSPYCGNLRYGNEYTSMYK
jgi:hypothetical protein